MPLPQTPKLIEKKLYKLTEEKMVEYRKRRIVKLIDEALGPSAGMTHRFDVALLEKQALRFFEFEQERVRRCSFIRPVIKKNNYIIGVCCYI